LYCYICEASFPSDERQQCGKNYECHDVFTVSHFKIVFLNSDFRHTKLLRLIACTAR